MSESDDPSPAPITTARVLRPARWHGWDPITILVNILDELEAIVAERVHQDDLPGIADVHDDIHTHRILVQVRNNALLQQDLDDYSKLDSPPSDVGEAHVFWTRKQQGAYLSYYTHRAIAKLMTR